MAFLSTYGWHTTCYQGLSKQYVQLAEDLYAKLFLLDPAGIGFRVPHQVSGEQLQRVMVAMAMACNLDIIVFDEPTTALDVTTQIEVFTHPPSRLQRAATIFGS